MHANCFAVQSTMMFTQRTVSANRSYKTNLSVQVYCLLDKKGSLVGPPTKPPLLTRKAEFNGGPTKLSLLDKKEHFSGPPH